MSYQIESGVCNGRGFGPANPNGFLEKFRTWVVKTPANGGPGWFLIDDQRLFATPYMVFCDVAAPLVNAYNTGPNGGAPKFIKIGLSATAGFINLQYLFWHDAVTHVGIPWSGYRIATVDDGDFAYDFRGGAECLIIQSRIGTSWSSTVIDEFVGDVNLLENTTKIGVLQAVSGIGNNITLTLGGGQANNFTQDKWYYIYDFTAGHRWTNYAKVTNVNPGASQITVDVTTKAFPIGSVIGAYLHRMYSLGSHPPNASEYNYQFAYSCIPYVSYQNPPIRETVGVFNKNFIASREIAYLNAIDPDDFGRQAVQKPCIVESLNDLGSNVGCNRGYGFCKNIYITQKGTMFPGLDGKIINGKQYLYFRSEQDLFTSGLLNYAVLFLDTASL